MCVGLTCAGTFILVIYYMACYWSLYIYINTIEMAIKNRAKLASSPYKCYCSDPYIIYIYIGLYWLYY